MNGLLDKFNDYKKIVNYTLWYELETGLQITFKYKQTDFPHLMGLHKLVDIPIIRYFNNKSNKTVSAKYILAKIKNETMLTEEDIKNSVYFKDIDERYRRFDKEHLCIAPNGNTTGHYAESFFFNTKDKYVINQNVVKVKNVKIYDAKRTLYLEDSF